MKTPCAACKYKRRKCTKDCVLAPYFPPESFKCVKKIFPVRTLLWILSEAPINQRQLAANSLYFEAYTRLRDPVFGMTGLSLFLKHEIEKKQQAMLPMSQQNMSSSDPQKKLFDASLTEEKKEMYRDQVKICLFYHGLCSEEELFITLFGENYKNEPEVENFWSNYGFDYVPTGSYLANRSNEMETEPNSDCEESCVTI